MKSSILASFFHVASIQIKIICASVDILQFVQIVGADTTLIEPLTLRLVNLGQIFQKTLFIK